MSEKSVSLYFATVLRGILTIRAFVHVYLLEVKLLAVIENSARVIREKTASFACVLTFVVIIWVDYGHVRVESAHGRSHRLLLLLIRPSGCLSRLILLRWQRRNCKIVLVTTIIRCCSSRDAIIYMWRCSVETIVVNGLFLT